MEPPLPPDMDEALERLYEQGKRSPGGQPVHLYDPKDEPEMLALEPDTYQQSVFKFFRYVDPQKDWGARGTVYLLGGKLVIGRVTIEPNLIRHADSPPASGVGRNVLREVPIGHISAMLQATIREAPQSLRLVRAAFPDMVDDAEEKRADEDAEVVQETKRGRPTQDDLYEQVARGYIAIGPKRGYRKELAILLEGFRGRPVRVDQVRDWVQRARRRGWLAEGVQGRPGAEPGPRLLALMIEESETKALKRNRTGKKT